MRISRNINVYYHIVHADHLDDGLAGTDGPRGDRRDAEDLVVAVFLPIVVAALPHGAQHHPAAARMPSPPLVCVCACVAYHTLHHNANPP